MLIVVVGLSACGSPDTSRTASPDGECPVHGADTYSTGPQTIEWIDVVHLDGRSYAWNITATDLGDAPEIDPAFIGRQIGRVCFDVATVVPGDGFEWLDGDATFLPVDTPIHAIRGSDPKFRVAVDVGHWRVYELFGASNAATSADLLDFSGGVDAIRVGDGERTFRPLVTVDDDQQVSTLLEELLAASARAQPSEPRKRLLVVFDRSDGSRTVRAVWPDAELLAPSIGLGEAWSSLLQAAE